MHFPKPIISGALVLFLASATGCSVFDSNSGGASSTGGSMISGDEQRVETLRSEVDEQERAAEEAKLRAKSEEERLKAKEHELKAIKREKKANEMRTGN